MTVAWIALVFSGASFALVLWEKFWRRPRFDVQADWILSSSTPVLRFVVFNTGYRKGTIRDIRLKERTMPRGRGWTPFERVMQHLPLVLDADTGSRAFLLQVDRQIQTASLFDLALGDGRIDELELEDAREQTHVFALPDLHAALHNAETNALPDMPRTTP